MSWGTANKLKRSWDFCFFLSPFLKLANHVIITQPSVYCTPSDSLLSVFGWKYFQKFAKISSSCCATVTWWELQETEEEPLRKSGWRSNSLRDQLDRSKEFREWSVSIIVWNILFEHHVAMQIHAYIAVLFCCCVQQDEGIFQLEMSVSEHWTLKHLEGKPADYKMKKILQIDAWRSLNLNLNLTMQQWRCVCVCVSRDIKQKRLSSGREIQVSEPLIWPDL